MLREARKRERFEALARSQLDALFRTASRMVGRRAVAEEIVQEACLKAYASFDPADEPAAFRPWLFRITVNLALDNVRRRSHEEPLERHAAGVGPAFLDGTLAGHPQLLAEGRDIGRALTVALAALAPDLRAVAVLVLVEEMSYAEAAAALSITEALVRSRLARARIDLRKQLAAHGADLTSQASAMPAPGAGRGAP